MIFETLLIAGGITAIAAFAGKKKSQPNTNTEQDNDDSGDSSDPAAVAREARLKMLAAIKDSAQAWLDKNVTYTAKNFLSRLGANADQLTDQAELNIIGRFLLTYNFVTCTWSIGMQQHEKDLLARALGKLGLTTPDCSGTAKPDQKPEPTADRTPGRLSRDELR